MDYNGNQLRRMTDDDLEIVLSWRNHIDVRKYMFTSHQISLSDHRAWFDRVSKDPEYHLLIFEYDNQPSGFVNLHQIAPGGIADWGFYIAPNAPKGAGLQLGELAIKFAFEEAGFFKLCGTVIAFNQRSSGFHLKLGFQKEGTLRMQHYDGKDYHDVFCFGLLLLEWEKKGKLGS